MSSKQFRVIVVAIALTAMLLLSMLMGALVFAAATPPQHDDDWYKVVNGVLDTDYYELYPYEETPLNIGFSKYGEMIGSPPSVPPNEVAPAAADWVGLDYDGIDPFCNPSSLIGMTQWLNGWYIDIEYVDPSVSGAARDKHIWAFALFADASAWGYDWTTVAEPTDAPHCGRKTNGIASTEDMKILYHGPRRLVAVLTTHIYDADGIPVVDVVITLVFDKVKKQVYMLKDIKLTIPKMHIDGRMDVQFSQREEWDLGAAAPFSSYAHMYHQYMSTCYTKDWHMADYLLRNWVDTITYNDSKTGQGLNGIVYMTRKIFSGYEKVYVNKYGDSPDAGWIFQIRGLDYDPDYNNSEIEFLAGHLPVDNDVVKIEYKYYYKGEDVPGTGTGINWTATENRRFYNSERPTWFIGDWDHVYDVAQIIDRTWSYVGWHAYWPTLSDYTVDGRMQWNTFLTNKQQNDATGTEPWFPPFLIGEWDFLLDDTETPAFRCVSVIGLTDQHNADDASAGGAHTNVIDLEVQYQLDQLFLPWDLNDAVHKEEQRNVEFFSGNGVKTEFALTEYPEFGTGSPTYYNDATYVGTYMESSAALWETYWFTNWQWNVSGIAEIGFSYEQNYTPDPYRYNKTKYWSVKWVIDDGPNEAASVRIVPTQVVSLVTAFSNGIDYWAYIDTQGTTPAAPYYPPYLIFYLDTDANGVWDERLKWNVTTDTLDAWVQYTLSPTSTVWEYVDGPSGPFGNITEGTWTGDITCNATIIYVDIFAGMHANFTDSVMYVDDFTLNGYTYNFEKGRLSPADWEDYCSFSERVLVGENLKIPLRAWPTSYDYTLTFSGTDTDSFTGDATTKTFTLDHTYVVPNTEIVVMYTDAPSGTTADIVGRGTAANEYTISNTLGKITFNTAPATDRIIRVFYQYYPRITFKTAATPPLGTDNIKVLYSTIQYENNLPCGRYEWIVVGRDAQSIDSVGAAMVSEYFDSTKNIDVWNGALDAQYSASQPWTPYLMEQLRPTLLPATTAYRDAALGYNTGRTAFRDDWCTTVPIQSSNIIAVGGPGANLAAEYFNDFTDAFYTLSGCTPTAADQGKIIPLSCWSSNRVGKDGVTHSYQAEYNATGVQVTGYGVVSTFKDLDGTIGFLVWGDTGPDTYYTAWILWNYLAQQYWYMEDDSLSFMDYLGIKLQTEPNCVTTVVIEFDYTIHPPDYCFWRVVECLGPISEYDWGSLTANPYYDDVNLIYKQPPIHPDP